ncbi:hypothetical protein T492DRAFT_835311 [Pavlovales sp. CCMP2436]|nr:hypothetical protein T492DRAFT_835311 [Pavlovales sp. CCMP2436]
MPTVSKRGLASACAVLLVCTILFFAASSDDQQLLSSNERSELFEEATGMGMWEDALAANPNWAATYGTKNTDLKKKEWGCPTPDVLEQWGTVCYGKCPTGFTRTFLCSCRENEPEE